MILQCFNESWSEYIDIREDKEINPGCKYKAILQLPKVIYVEESLDTLSKSKADLNATTFLNMQTENVFSPQSPAENLMTDSRELSEPSTSESAIGSNEIHVGQFSSSLNEALDKQLPLMRMLRSELVGAVCKSITVATKYPSSIMMTDAARTIVRKYPYLTNYWNWIRGLATSN